MNAHIEKSEGLERIQRDLSTLQNAAGIGLPFGREVVWFWLTVSLGSGVLALVAAWGGAAQKLVAVAFFSVLTSALFLGVLVRSVRGARERAERPAFWREFRTITMAKAIVMPFVIGFFVVQGMLGAPPKFIASTATFLVGLVSLVYGISSWSRRPAVGLAIPIMVFAAVLPILSGPQIVVFAPLSAMVATLATAAALAWQLSRARV